MKRFIILLISLIFINCTINEKKVIKKEKSNSFEKLSKIELPIEYYCGESLELFDNDSITKYIVDFPKGLRFGGLINKRNEFSTILLADTYADYQLHFIATVDKKGKMIDIFKLFSKDCGVDENYECESKYQIDKELNIKLSDSTATYERTESGEIIDKTIKVTTNSIHYSIDEKGKVTKNSI
jgi:hypothetical protein